MEPKVSGGILHERFGRRPYVEQRGGIAKKQMGSWTIRWDGSDEDDPVSDEITSQLENLDADGEHVVVTRTEDGIERVAIA